MEAVWCGPFCSAEGVGPFGEPERVLLLGNEPGGGATPPLVVASIPVAGWDVKRRRPLVGLQAVVRVEDQTEDALLAHLLPAALQGAYTGFMRYRDGGEYDGAWCRAKRHGTGTMR